VVVVLHLDPLAPPTPRLPDERFGLPAQLAASTALHLIFLTIALIAAASTRDGGARRAEPIDDQHTLDVGHVVFLAPDRPQPGTGGGGGGNQRPEPLRRAQGVGSDPITLRVGKQRTPAVSVTPAPAPAIEDVPPLPSIVLDAKPLASGLFEQVGLPAGGVVSGASTGPGSGGGVGTGTGTGIGPGRGPGFGPGSGGGTGGGVYRPGGAVSGPRLIKEVKPKYTSQALRNTIQGSVVLEAVVTVEGCASQIRVIRSLDAGGLDEEAVMAVAQWRFEPGRLGTTPVPVIVTIVVDFSVR
jgi:TonB family protein